MKLSQLLFAAVAVGVVCGIVSNTPILTGQWANLVLWALAGIGLGLFAAGRRAVLWAGIVYGLALTISFLGFAFGGTPDKLPVYLLLTLGLSVVGAVAGIVTVFIGSLLRRLVLR
ncbi:MAG: hypothetical protein ABI847_08110 [Anaerolineales bacterium]